MVIHENSGINAHVILPEKFDGWPDTLSHHHHLAIEGLPVAQYGAGDAPEAVALDGRDLDAHLHRKAVSFQFGLDERSRFRVHLHGEGMVGTDQHGDRQTSSEKPVSRLKTDETAAQHQCVPSALERFEHPAHILGLAHGEDATSIRRRRP